MSLAEDDPASVETSKVVAATEEAAAKLVNGVK